MLASETRVLNQNVVRDLTSNNDGIRKEAEDKVSQYLRLQVREEGFARKFYDVVEVTPADLDKQVDTPLPVIVKDKEPNSSGAYTVPFGTAPMDSNITAPRYRVMFDRVMSRRYVADVNTLLTYDMDIRQIFNDFILTDIMMEEDSKWITLVNRIVKRVAVNTVQPSLRSCQWIQAGVMDRPNMANAMRGLPSTRRRLNPAVALTNNLTVWDVVGFDRNTIGGDLAEDLFVNGFTERNLMGIKWILTIKQDLVPDNYVYYVASPKYLGDFMVLDNITTSTKHEDFILSFYAYECVGSTIGNDAALVLAEFTGSAHNWKTGALL